MQMRKFFLALVGCAALVTFMGTATASAGPPPIVDPSCDGDPYPPTPPALYEFEITTDADKPFAGQVAGILGGGIYCGTVMRANPTNCGVPPEGSGTLMNHAVIGVPPGVVINDTGPVPVGSRSGFANFNIASCLVGPFSDIIKDVDADTLIADKARCEADRAALVLAPGESLAGEIVACHRSDDVTRDLGFNYSYSIRDENGRYKTIIGPIDPIVGQAGLTRIRDFSFCGYAGVDDVSQCGDSSQPWLQINGDASVPFAPNRAFPPSASCLDGNGLYTAYVVNNDAVQTATEESCVQWRPTGPTGISRR